LNNLILSQLFLRTFLFTCLVTFKQIENFSIFSAETFENGNNDGQLHPSPQPLGNARSLVFQQTPTSSFMHDDNGFELYPLPASGFMQADVFSPFNPWSPQPSCASDLLLATAMLTLASQILRSQISMPWLSVFPPFPWGPA
jgi:hypothetical protein